MTPQTTLLGCQPCKRPSQGREAREFSSGPERTTVQPQRASTESSAQRLIVDESGHATAAPEAAECQISDVASAFMGLLKRPQMGCERLGSVATIQTTDEIRAILERLVGQKITNPQVLGINSLKSFSPMPDALAGDTIEASVVSDRLFTMTTTGHEVTFGLQRSGKLV